MVAGPPPRAAGRPRYGLRAGAGRGAPKRIPCRIEPHHPPLTAAPVAAAARRCATRRAIVPVSPLLL